MKITPEYLKTLSDEEVAKLMVSPNDDYISLLAAQESDRRGRLYQHELDIKLMARQVRWMKFSAIIGVVGSLAGVYLGTYLEHNWPQTQQPISKIQVQQRISSLSAVHHIRTSVLNPKGSPPLKK